MNLKDWILRKIFKIVSYQTLDDNPNGDRLTYVSDDEAIKISEIQANKIWFVGNGDELLNYYTNQQVKGFADNPIYNRNKRNYFWSLSSQECDIKRVHSGVPNAIIATFTNIIGMPTIKENTGKWIAIAEENDFENKLTQQARPLTLACGFGAWKPNIRKELSKHPLWEFYDAENVEYVYESGVLTGILFKSYYRDEKNKNYVLVETRYKRNRNSYIDYNLFELKKNNDVNPVSLDVLQGLADVPRETMVFEGLDEILAVPSKYFYDSQNPKYGKSIYAGKLDLFDFLDETISQASQTCRVSTPVEYYDTDALERGPNGLVGMPNLYNRQFVKKCGVPDGDGNVNDAIITTQPELNFDKYGGLALDIINWILVGVLSPSTMGFDVAKKDNADAQREKEKVTIFNRNNIITNESKMIKKIVTLSLLLNEYIETGNINIQDYEIEVKYNDFANPSFETRIQTLGNAWTSGQMSTTKYVDLLWLDELDEMEKIKEIQWLDEHQQQDNAGDLDMSEMMAGEDNVQEIGNDVPPTGEVEEKPVGNEE